MSNTPIADKIIKWIYEGHNPETGKEYFERKLKEKEDLKNNLELKHECKNNSYRKKIQG